MNYRVRLSCPDCSDGQDPQGCFDGDTELLEEQFSSIAAALAAGHAATRNSIWDFSIEDEDGRELEKSETEPHETEACRLINPTR